MGTEQIETNTIQRDRGRGYGVFAVSLTVQARHDAPRARARAGTLGCELSRSSTPTLGERTRSARATERPDSACPVAPAGPAARDIAVSDTEATERTSGSAPRDATRPPRATAQRQDQMTTTVGERHLEPRGLGLPMVCNEGRSKRAVKRISPWNSGGAAAANPRPEVHAAARPRYRGEWDQMNQRLRLRGDRPSSTKDRRKCG